MAPTARKDSWQLSSTWQAVSHPLQGKCPQHCDSGKDRQLIKEDKQITESITGLNVKKKENDDSWSEIQGRGSAQQVTIMHAGLTD